jgi:hypothetical protein
VPYYTSYICVEMMRLYDALTTAHSSRTVLAVVLISCSVPYCGPASLSRELPAKKLSVAVGQKSGAAGVMTCRHDACPKSTCPDSGYHSYSSYHHACLTRGAGLAGAEEPRRTHQPPMRHRNPCAPHGPPSSATIHGPTPNDINEMGTSRYRGNALVSDYLT